jgi:peroxiredoxin
VRAEGEIAGAVVDPDGKPLAGARVSAGRGGATGVFVVNEETATDEQGRFRIHRLPPGVVNLAASQAGYYGDRREKVPVGAVNVRFVLAPIEEAASELSMARVGVTAPEIRVARWLNGDGVTSWTALRGKTVVLQFSSAYNRAARASNEALKALHARLREAGRNDVVILAVYDASAPADEVAAYARSEGLPFPIGLVEPSRNLGVDSAAFRAYGVRRLPALFVIDRDGILRAIDPDGEELARRLEMKAGQ